MEALDSEENGGVCRRKKQANLTNANERRGMWRRECTPSDFFFKSTRAQFFEYTRTREKRIFAQEFEAIEAHDYCRFACVCVVCVLKRRF